MLRFLLSKCAFLTLRPNPPLPNPLRTTSNTPSFDVRRSGPRTARICLVGQAPSNMSMSTSVGRQGLARALVRSLKHSNSMSQGQRTVSSASVSFRNSQHRLYSRTAQVGGAWWTVRRPHLGEKRWISAGGVKGDDSDDDFKPKRKVVSDNPDDVADLIKNQVSSYLGTRPSCTNSTW